MAVGERWTDYNLVFTSCVGTPMNESRSLKWPHLLQDRTEVPRTRIHDLRHPHATLLLLAGVPVHVVAARLGDDPATVLRVYSHLLPSTQREAAAKFETIIGAEPDGNDE